ncbi:MAG: hypothetical protein CM1200mP28_09020 [Deltaproteobacteria bacterium]|nr:MAG: hypothetical protein CM1200mP28_09020 [Deltaproteobacteria bacterium]
MQILKATLEERLDSKENESREKLKFLEEAKKLMGTEFENLSPRFLIQSRSSLLKQIKIIFKTY